MNGRVIGVTGHVEDSETGPVGVSANRVRAAVRPDSSLCLIQHGCRQTRTLSKECCLLCRAKTRAACRCFNDTG